MYTREELEKKTNKELYDIAASLGISKYVKGNRKTKTVIIEEVLGTEVQTEEPEKNVDNIVFIDGNDVEEQTSEKSELKVVAEHHDSSVKRKEYIESAQIGTIVAYRTENGKVKSAKIINRSTSKRRFKVETKYGAQSVISFDDVVWVKTGTRWPKGVYNLMKGIGEEDGKSE